MSDDLHPKGRNGGDPTANVRELFNDSIRRLDDLRAAEVRRISELSAAETRRVNEITALRDRYEEKLAVAEAGRLDANRTMDESARVVDREKAATQATLLAADVKSTAETARLLVAQTREEATKNLDQRLNPILDKLASLEQAQFQGAGERRATDPAQLQMAEDVRALLRSKEKSEGRAGLSQPMLLTIVGAVAAFASWLIQQAIR